MIQTDALRIQFLRQHRFCTAPHLEINICSPLSGNPVLVEVSVSLRNILEIDEHKQVSSSLIRSPQ